MKLSKKNKLVVSFMLFSLFFGAGNLIFPPFLGQNAGNNTAFGNNGIPYDGGNSARTRSSRSRKV